MEIHRLQEKGGKEKKEGDPSSFDELKFHVRHLLLQQEVEPLPKLRVVDTVQRLGVAYHFDDEISAILNSVSTGRQDVDRMDDVRLMTLSFRLLRQNNYPVSQVLLRSLKDGSGNFKKMLQKDTQGLLSLYEASHLAFEGEYLLDEARVFSTEALRGLIMPSMHPHLRSSVDNALAVPLHWAAPRLQARWFINHYTRESRADLLLLHFAKLDFNNVQKLQQQELSRITPWWRNANLNESVPFARDRLMECFYFATGVAPEPSLEACPEVVAITFALIVLLDDIYGTLDELVMFTDAIERWEASASEQLPEYMKAIYLTIVSTSNEVAEQVLRQEGCDARFLLKKAWHDLCKAFLMEAKWHYSNYKPTLHEYLENGWIPVSGPLMLIHAFPMIEKKGVVTPNSIRQLESYPKLVQMVSKIFRLCNDSATHSEELKRGDAPSSIAIYMSENRATEHDARKAMRDLTMETWKMVNQDAFSNCRFPLPFANACVNMARIAHCIYRGGDGISAPYDDRRLEIKELFLEPFKVEN
ncbi:alpha-thujene synthase, chloroplastic-like [Miscanthus floridulus]|uniref:alpha-thujene synthase, chloroplastic-like n=1 Tax=Miscanthus floridulus TaxID=154761 RepID=UPI00345AA2BB